MKVLEIAVGPFSSDQVLLSSNFLPRSGCRRKFLLRNSGVGGGGRSVLLMIVGGKSESSPRTVNLCFSNRVLVKTMFELEGKELGPQRFAGV